MAASRGPCTGRWPRPMSRDAPSSWGRPFRICNEIQRPGPGPGVRNGLSLQEAGSSRTDGRGARTGAAYDPTGRGQGRGCSLCVGRHDESPLQTRFLRPLHLPRRNPVRRSVRVLPSSCSSSQIGRTGARAFGSLDHASLLPSSRKGGNQGSDQEGRDEAGGGSEDQATLSSVSGLQDLTRARSLAPSLRAILILSCVPMPGVGKTRDQPVHMDCAGTDLAVIIQIPRGS